MRNYTRSPGALNDGSRAARGDPRRPTTNRHKPTRRRNRVRIVGGRWRGRLVDVVAGTAVRPTPDRVRETVFNWLAATLDGVRCLDLFAGTGVLGLEALSRGAADAVFVERDRALVAALRTQIEALGAAAQVVDGAAATYLRGAPQRAFGLVFLDPPYATALEPLLTLLPAWLGEAAMIYVERPRAAVTLSPLAASVPGLRVAKEAHAGDVLYGLLRYERA